MEVEVEVGTVIVLLSSCFLCQWREIERGEVTEMEDWDVKFQRWLCNAIGRTDGKQGMVNVDNRVFQA